LEAQAGGSFGTLRREGRECRTDAIWVPLENLFQSTGNHWHQDGIDATARVELSRTLLKIFRVTWSLKVKRKANVSICTKTVVFILDYGLSCGILAPLG